MRLPFLALATSAVSALSCSADGGSLSSGGAMDPEPMMPVPTATATATTDPVPSATPPMPSSTATPTATAEADAGPPTRDPNVHFTWPEATLEGPCLPGVYEGTFSCSLPAGLFATPFTVTGPVSFTLAESENGEFLEITDGVLNGDAMGILFTSALAGQLDCVSNTFEADAVDGTYGPFPFVGTFAGTLDAQLDRTSQTLNGQWSLSPNGQQPCVGPWSATRQP